MAEDFVVRGADDVDELVRKIRTHADAKALRKELYSGLNRVTKDIRGELVEVFPAALPTRGGLSALLQGSTRWNTSAKSGKYAGATLWAKNRSHDIRTLTGKRLRHPVYGHRGTWVNQTAGVEPQVVTGKFEQQKPDVQRALLDVLNTIAKKVT